MNALDVDLYVLLDFQYQKSEKEIRAYRYLHESQRVFSDLLYKDRVRCLTKLGYLAHCIGMSDDGIRDHWWVTEEGIEKIKECMERSSIYKIRRLSKKYGVVRDQLHIFWESLPYAFIIYFIGIIIFSFIRKWIF